MITNDPEKKKRALLQSVLKSDGYDMVVNLAERMIADFREAGSETQDTIEQSALNTAKFEGRRLGIIEFLERLQLEAFGSKDLTGDKTINYT